MLSRPSSFNISSTSMLLAELPAHFDLVDLMSQSGAQACRVLVVEDEPLVRAFALEILLEAGYSADEAANAAEAFEKLHGSTAFAVVLTDIEMPGAMNGLDLAWAIQAHWPHTRVILTSGRQLPRPDEMPVKTRFVAKPYRPELLVQILTEIMS